MAEGLGAETLFYRNEQEFFGGGRTASRGYSHGGGATPRRARLPFAKALPEPLGAVECFPFDRFGLSAVRRFIGAAAAEAGVDPARRSDVVLAASELAANSIVHGGGTGEARVWCEPAAFACEVVDAGVIRDPMVGRRQPPPEQLNGRGLWIVNQLADQLELHSDEGGSAVRFRVKLH
jgi:anti-sigma regulatory factor (Ser/Thr protein kinase)